MRYSHFSPSELGLCHQLQEVCVSRRPMSCVVIPGIGNSFVEYEGGALQRETRKDQETMSVSTLAEKVSVRDLPKITGRETLLYGNDSSSSTYTTKEASTTTDYRLLHEGIIQRHNCVTQRGKNGSGLAGAESESEQPTVHTAHYRRDCNPI